MRIVPTPLRWHLSSGPGFGSTFAEGGLDLRLPEKGVVPIWLTPSEDARSLTSVIVARRFGAGLT